MMAPQADGAETGAEPEMSGATPPVTSDHWVTLDGGIISAGPELLRPPGPIPAASIGTDARREPHLPTKKPC